MPITEFSEVTSDDAQPNRERLPDDEALSYTATVRFADGRVGEIFLSNHKSGSAADVIARNAAIACSIPLQCGADLETIRKALCRDSRERASGPLGVALDLLADQKTA